MFSGYASLLHGLVPVGHWPNASGLVAFTNGTPPLLAQISLSPTVFIIIGGMGITLEQSS